MFNELFFSCTSRLTITGSKIRHFCTVKERATTLHIAVIFNSTTSSSLESVQKLEERSSNYFQLLAHGGIGIWSWRSPKVLLWFTSFQLADPHPVHVQLLFDWAQSERPTHNPWKPASIVPGAVPLNNFKKSGPLAPCWRMLCVYVGHGCVALVEHGRKVIPVWAVCTLFRD